MDLLNLLLSRRSIRRYTESPIPQRALETILAAGLLSPSSRGRRPWEFVVVQNPKTLEALSHCRQGSAAMLAGAKAAILVFADPEKTDVWTEDCAIAMSNMHLMAHHLGLGSCWIQGPPAPGGGRYLHRGLLPRAALRPGPLHLGGHSLPGLSRHSAGAPQPGGPAPGKIHWDTF